MAMVEMYLRINYTVHKCTRRRKTMLSNFSKLLSLSMMYIFTKCVEYNGEERKEKGLTNLFVCSEM